MIQATLVNRIGNGVVGDVQVQLFGKLVRADLARLRSQHSGAYVSSVLYDAGLIREAATAGVINYTQHLLIVIGAITVMVSNDRMLSLVLVAGRPGAAWIMRRFSKRTTKAAKGAMAETSALSTAIMESLDGVRVVKIENREAYEEARVAEVVRRRQNHLIKGANARARAAPATELLMTLITAGGHRLRRLALAERPHDRRRLRGLHRRPGHRLPVAAPARQPADGVRRGHVGGAAAVRRPRRGAGGARAGRRPAAAARRGDHPLRGRRLRLWRATARRP